MDFEYGCVITNKYSFLNENEDQDPSELLAQVSQGKEKDAKQTTGKDAKTGKTAKATDAKTGKTAIAAKDKKQPLQQKTDNSVKATGGQQGRQGSANQKQAGPKPVGQSQQPREDKENTSNRVGSGNDQQNNRRSGDNQNRPRPPRPEGEGGYRGNNDGTRPPRRQGPRPEGAGQDRPDRPDRPPRRPRPQYNQEGGVVEGGEGGNVEGGEGGFRRGGSGGNYRGRGGNYRGGFRPRREGEREFDRHSGSEKTGVKAVDKKDGAGKANWGEPVDELVIEDAQTETAEPTENPNWAETVNESEEVKNEEDDEKNQPGFMTLDEYKALKNEIAKKNEFNIRKPGEGEDTSKWGKTYELKKKKKEEEDEDEEEEEEEEEQEEEEDPEEVKKRLLLNQIKIKFNEPASSGRGGRGRGRGEGRGGSRPDRTNVPQQQKANESIQSNTSEPAANANEQEEPQQSPEKPRVNRDGNRGGSRGGRGGPGGRGGRGGQSRGSNQPRVNVPRIEDEKDFPSLVKA